MDYVKNMKLIKEMKAVGISQSEIGVFVVLGVGLWAVLLWMFIVRYNEINDVESGDSFFSEDKDKLESITLIILSFHAVTFVFTLLETYFMNSNIWVSWLTIGLALSATFLNAASVAILVTDDDFRYPLVNTERAIASLVLQCIANALMTAYIFKLIRSKRKLSY